MRLVDGAGSRIAVHTVDGPAARARVVLLHGTGGTAATWDVVAADLARDRTVHAVDLRGHGASEWPGTYSVDLMAADLAAVLPQLGTDLDVIGHSLGGLVAARTIAGGAPVRRLVLEDVGVRHPRPPATPDRPDGSLDFDWAVVEQVRPEIDSPAEHWPATFSDLTVPTLVVGGGPSSFVPRDHLAELVGLLPHGSLVTLDTGHEVHATAPGDFLAAVRAFLDGSLS
jgi:pimeloyl-ACP methyl ester carboxylesterase